MTPMATANLNFCTAKARAVFGAVLFGPIRPPSFIFITKRYYVVHLLAACIYPKRKRIRSRSCTRIIIYSLSGLSRTVDGWMVWMAPDIPPRIMSPEWTSRSFFFHLFIYLFIAIRPTNYYMQIYLAEFLIGSNNQEMLTVQEIQVDSQNFKCIYLAII